MQEAAPLRMSDEEFRLLRELIQQHCGIFFDDHMKYLLERRLARRVEHRLLRSFREYEQYLRYDPSRADELTEIVELLTTNETYFFRESYQLDALSKEVLPELLARKREREDPRIRIWSAGCSTGEEPYTLAILLAETPSMAGFEWEIFATDISRRALQQARSATYRAHSFRNGIPDWAARHFLPQEGGMRQVRPEIRQRVSFAALNLVDKERLGLVRNLDIIFCRNVIIYFDLATKKELAGTFYEKLQAGGYLFLGHSESLINLSTRFKLRHFKHDMIYQRPLVGEEGAQP